MRLRATAGSSDATLAAPRSRTFCDRPCGTSIAGPTGGLSWAGRLAIVLRGRTHACIGVEVDGAAGGFLGEWRKRPLIVRVAMWPVLLSFVAPNLQTGGCGPRQGI